MPPDSIKVISFDAAGTLIHLAEEVGTSYSRVAERHGIRVFPETLNEAFKTVWKRTPPPFSADAPTNHTRERDWWCELVKAIFAETSADFPDDDAFQAFFEDLYLHFETPGTWTAPEGTRELLEQIGTRYRCVVLSNFDSRLRRILHDLDLIALFENLFLSCEMRLSKPDPAIFREMSETLGVRPGEILHVGDDPVCDWAGAKSAGYHIFRVGRGQRNLSEILNELSLA